MADKSGYDARTLVGAAAILIGFGALLYYLPAIMLAVGAENRWLAILVVAIVLALPFVGLWLRSRSRRGMKK